ncbi:hypothetical protein BT93_J1290 [Corymbia citriodora subsp. variegata]|nr:hypothetical protein BT93_J1290 [Corymbia citriodora subsp. variegata]
MDNAVSCSSRQTRAILFFQQQQDNLGMAPLPPTSQRMKGKSPQIPDIEPPKFKRPLVSKRYGEIFYPDEASQILQLESMMRSFQADIGRDTWMVSFKKYQHRSSRVENEELKRRMGYCADKMGSKQAEFVELMKEIEKLTDVYIEQRRNDEELLKRNMNQMGLPTTNFM